MIIPGITLIQLRGRCRKAVSGFLNGNLGIGLIQLQEEDELR